MSVAVSLWQNTQTHQPTWHCTATRQAYNAPRNRGRDTGYKDMDLQIGLAGVEYILRGREQTKKEAKK